MSTVNALRRNQFVRSLAIPIYRGVARLSPTSSEVKICVNSIPKGGTHLVTSVLNKIPDIIFSGYHLSEEDVFTQYPAIPGGSTIDTSVKKVLSRCRKGQYLTMHSPFDSRVSAQLKSFGFGKIFLLRDPRDILVSYVNYVLREKRHFHHDYFNKIGDFDKLLGLTINGFHSNEDVELGLPSVKQMLERYSGWLDDPEIVVLRFENLIGEKGGGTLEAQFLEVEKILKVAGIGVSPKMVESISGKTYSENSVTFSKGSIRQWEKSFNASNRKRFEETASDEMHRLGYV